EPPSRKGLSIGLDQYRLYQIRNTDIRYYTLEKAYTDAFYAQGAEQSDSYLRLRFSRNLTETGNISLQFQRISELGSTNQYPYQNGRTTASGVGYWYRAPNKRYNGFFSFVSNLTEQEDNGGLATEPTTEAGINSPTTATIFLSAQQAKTSHRYNGLSYAHYYRLSQPSDSTNVTKRDLTLHHRIAYQTQTYKSYDLRADANFYGTLWTYANGLRHFIDAQTVQNEFKISTHQLQKIDAKTSRAKNWLEVGLRHDINRIHQEPIDTSIQTLLLTGRLHFSPTPSVELRSYAHLGLLDQAGDFRIEGQLRWHSKKVGVIDVAFINQAVTPNLVETRTFISQRAVWDNDFSKTITTSLTADYTIPRLQTQLSVRSHLIDNYIYFDSLAMPQQTTSIINVLQLVAAQDFKIGILRLDNTFIFQSSASELLPAPRIFSKHSLYLSGKLFRRVLDMKIGFDLRVNTAFFPRYYMPLTGQFQLQQTQEAPIYPLVDFFFNAKIDRFRAFVKAENLTDLVSRDFYYQTAYYPQTVFTVRFGIFWRFVN
ncbi:MAG: putative porin, partial [Bacteroidota bacterium]